MEKIQIKKASTKKEILNFIDIYYENMDRVQARSSYYFKPDYFFKFSKHDDGAKKKNIEVKFDTNAP